MEPTPNQTLGDSIETKVEELDGTQFFRLRLPADYQGHTFALQALPQQGEDKMPPGPYILKFVLTSEFLLHFSSVNKIKIDAGFSHILVTDTIAKSKFTFHYFATAHPDQKRQGTLELVVHENRLSALVVRIPEVNIDAAVRHASQLVSSFLDEITLRACIPIQVRNLDVTCETKAKSFLQYVTIPYSDVFLREDDLINAALLPRRLGPAMRLFREAISTSKPHYRLLCLYKTREALARITKENDIELIKSGARAQRSECRVPDNMVTRNQFAPLIGKRVGAFFDHIRAAFRLPIAHGGDAVNDRLELDPADVRTDHRVDAANAIMIQLMKELIQDERDVMKKHGLA